VTYEQDIAKQALDFAERYHGDQKYGPYPYRYHLEKVVEQAIRRGGSEEEILACALHDVLEDTACTFDELRAAWGPRVAKLVWAVTNVKTSRGHTDRIRTYWNVLSFAPSSLFVKLCDRYANVREGGKLAKYIREYPLFREMLRPTALQHRSCRSLFDDLDHMLGWTDDA